MGQNKLRVLLIASIMIMICAATLVGGTYALWSKKVEVNNHLVAGKLDLKLERTKLVKSEVNEKGYITNESSTDVVDLGASNANAFGIEDDELIVPTSSYEAEIKLTNNGSVAVQYEVIIKLTDGEELAGQLMVSVDGEEKGYLSTFSGDEERTITSKALAINDSSTFTIKVEFVNNDDTNNAVMSKESKFDLVIKAVQKTSEN